LTWKHIRSRRRPKRPSALLSTTLRADLRSGSAAGWLGAGESGRIAAGRPRRARTSAQSLHTGHFLYTRRAFYAMAGVRSLRKRSRPISRVLSRTIIHLRYASPRTSSDLPGSPCGPHARPHRETKPLLPYLVLLQAGFAVPPSVTTGAVRSYRTLSPLPAPPLRAGLRRFAFCCTFRGLAPPRRYLAPCPGSPDFPPRLRAAIVWPTPRVMVGSIGGRSKSFAEPQRGFVQLAAFAAGDVRRDLCGL